MSINTFKVVEIKLQVYIPADLTTDDEIEEYLNDRLSTDPEFFGYIDSGCFSVIGEETL